jgi:hypothetical protein
MAGRILNRRELRKQADQAEQQSEPVALDPADPVAPAKPAAKRKARAKPGAAKAAGVKAPRVRASKSKTPPRMRARWGVFDGGMKEVATFDYNQRGDAEVKLAELLGKKKGIYFLQIVKQPMAEAAPAETAPVA